MGRLCVASNEVKWIANNNHDVLMYSLVRTTFFFLRLCYYGSRIDICDLVCIYNYVEYILSILKK